MKFIKTFRFQNYSVFRFSSVFKRLIFIYLVFLLLSSLSYLFFASEEMLKQKIHRDILMVVSFAYFLFIWFVFYSLDSLIGNLRKYTGHVYSNTIMERKSKNLKSFNKFSAIMLIVLFLVYQLSDLCKLFMLKLKLLI